MYIRKAASNELATVKDEHFVNDATAKERRWPK